MTPVLLHWAESGARVAAAMAVSGVWQGIVLAVGVALGLRVFPRMTAAVRFGVWGTVFALVAVLPMVHRSVAAGTAAHAVHVDARWSFAVAAVWVGLSAVRAVELVMGALRLRGVWRRAVPVEGGLTEEILRVGRRVAVVCVSADVETPSVIGFFAPRVLIPASLYGRLGAAELEQIVLHEMGHLRRGDDWMNLLQKIGLVVFPLNPALAWVEKRLCLERELACDDSVLRRTKAPKAYATCLTTLAEHRLTRRGLALTLGAWAREPELSQRVYSILGWRDRVRTRQSQVVAGGMLLVLAGGAVGLSRCPQLVSFSRDLPGVAAAQGADGAGYQPVVYRDGSEAGGRVTLLKATLPVAAPVALKAEAPKVARPRLRKVVRAVAPERKRVRGEESRRWVVMTSFEESRDVRAVMTVSREEIVAPARVVFASYAAVPTEGGWLIFQL